MSDPRFFAILLAVFAVAIVALLCILDYFQPGGLNNELIKQVMFLVSPIVPAFLVLMNSNAARKDIKEGQQDVKQAVHDEGQSIKRDAERTASELAQKGK